MTVQSAMAEYRASLDHRDRVNFDLGVALSELRICLRILRTCDGDVSRATKERIVAGLDEAVRMLEGTP